MSRTAVQRPQSHAELLIETLALYTRYGIELPPVQVMLMQRPGYFKNASEDVARKVAAP